MDKELHTYAKELLDAGKVNEAWQVLLARLLKVPYPPNTFFNRSVVLAAKLFRIFLSSCATRSNSALVAFIVTKPVRSGLIF